MHSRKFGSHVLLELVALGSHRHSFGCSLGILTRFRGAIVEGELAATPFPTQACVLPTR
jgi:hypothetical protein